MIPTVDKSWTRIGILREPRAETFVFFFENGDSYECSLEESLVVLKLLGINEEEEKLLDYVHNFYSVIYLLKEQRMIPCTHEELKGAMV